MREVSSDHPEESNGQRLVRLSDDVQRLLVAQGKHRLTEDELVRLIAHLNMICEWANRVPATTQFFFVDWEPILVLPNIPGYTKDELAIAAYLQPLHSHLCALALQVLWKSDQFIRALCSAFNAGDLIVAATMARSLIETSAAFGSETWVITRLWKERKAQPAPNLDSLCEFHEQLKGAIGQILFGTKLKREKEPETGIERTNILTLIDRAGRDSEAGWIRRIYDVLCDTVHPSIGSNRCFWAKEPWAEKGPIVRCEVSRHARNVHDDLPFAIGKGTYWALLWLGEMWVRFELTRNDICLTGKLYALPPPYWGIIRPGDPSGYCSCGSQLREDACEHNFGAGRVNDA